MYFMKSRNFRVNEFNIVYILILFLYIYTTYNMSRNNDKIVVINHLFYCILHSFKGR
jgi:hypothetical protein